MADKYINEHIKNVYEDQELDEATTIKKFGISNFRISAKGYNYYNLDVFLHHKPK